MTIKDKELFDLFQSKTNDFDLCIKIQNLMDKRIRDVRGKENAQFYEVLVKLSNSINNAGWQDRHSDQIDFINKQTGRICDEYGDYLP